MDTVHAFASGHDLKETWNVHMILLIKIFFSCPSLYYRAHTSIALSSLPKTVCNALKCMNAKCSGRYSQTRPISYRLSGIEFNIDHRAEAKQQAAETLP